MTTLNIDPRSFRYICEKVRQDVEYSLSSKHDDGEPVYAPTLSGAKEAYADSMTDSDRSYYRTKKTPRRVATQDVTEEMLNRAAGRAPGGASRKQCAYLAALLTRRGKDYTDILGSNFGNCGFNARQASSYIDQIKGD